MTDQPERHTSVMMEYVREGVWEVPASLDLRGIRSDTVLDLREATFAAPEVTVQLWLWSSHVRIVLGPDVAVTTIGSGTASWTLPDDGPDPEEAAHLLVLTGRVRFGSVTVERP